MIVVTDAHEFIQYNGYHIAVAALNFLIHADPNKLYQIQNDGQNIYVIQIETEGDA